MMSKKIANKTDKHPVILRARKIGSYLNKAISSYKVYYRCFNLVCEKQIADQVTISSNIEVRWLLRWNCLK